MFWKHYVCLTMFQKTVFWLLVSLVLGTLVSCKLWDRHLHATDVVTKDPKETSQPQAKQQQQQAKTFAPLEVLPKTPKASGAFKEVLGHYDDHAAVCRAGNCGDPLFLTPYIKSNEIDTAVLMAKVSGHPELDEVTSYSGFLTTSNGTSNYHTFFWFFPALDRETSSPIIVWLQGGPGQSGLHGLFNMHGPFELNDTLELNKRHYTWARSLNVLYLDNPVGVGFSFVSGLGRDKYPTTQRQIADTLYETLRQFFTMFPDYTDNHVYICGEGFGAKFAVSLAHKVHSAGRETIFNLKGIALGSPDLDQEVKMDRGQYYYELGLLNEDQLNIVTSRLQKINAFINRLAYKEATDALEMITGTDYTVPVDKSVYLPALTGIPHDQNILDSSNSYNLDRYVKFIERADVRKAIHVGHVPFQNGSLAYYALRQDIPRSVKDMLGVLLDNYRVLFYGGNMDGKAPFAMSMELLRSIQWKHLHDYKNSTRMIWRVSKQDTEITGYIHHVKNFFEVMIRNCGHVVSTDQPRAALDMMNRFIWGRAFIVDYL